MKRDPDFFGDAELDLLYISKRLKDALRLEAALTESGIDYGVETDEYRGGVVFTTARIGAFFYVRPECVAAAREVMMRHKFKPYEEPVPQK